jgi:phosphohistidine phosphatase SixA
MRATAGLLGIVLLLTAVGSPRAEQAAGPALVVLVRHADPGATPRNDPSLNEAGKARAQVLAMALRDAGITAIFTSTYRRTRETAAPLAAALGIEAVPIAGADPDAHVRALLAAVRAQRGAVLVVGHSDTVPLLIEKLDGPHLDTLCDVHDRLLMLVPAAGKAHLVRSHYGAAEPDPGPNCP